MRLSCYTLLAVTFFLSLISTSGHSQGYLLLSGKVIDKSTQTPIAHAYVGMMSKSTGTLTNEDGQFFYRFPRIAADSAVVVAVIGYKPFQQKASAFQLNQKDVVIELEPAVPRIVDSSFIKTFEARNLISDALGKIKKNNPQMPYVLNGFYRESLQQNGEYVDIREAVLQTEKDPRPKILVPEKVKALRGRHFLSDSRSKVMEGYSFPNGATIVTHSIDVGIPEYLDGKNLYDYAYQLDDTIAYYLDKQVYRVFFRPVNAGIKAARTGIISICAADSAIIRIEYDFTAEGVKDVLKTGASDKVFGKTKRDAKRVYTCINYKPFMGKWYLQDYRMLLDTQFEQNKVQTLGSIKLQFVATEIQKSNGMRIPETDVLIDTENFSPQVIPKYDEVVWGNFNFVIPSEAMRQIVNTLTK
ncbi:carboxypeptidase-like regulatory domain-containing protein [Runella sp.]|uniref:carboxypeptidase-like regulatory domain-containing protein n=1 Tax=Runella sp. TaxID=1960881 RepID=UPI003D0D2300